MYNPHKYVIYAHDPRDGYTRWDFYDLYNCRKGGEELVSKYPAAGYKIVNKQTGKVVRRHNFTD